MNNFKLFNIKNTWPSIRPVMVAFFAMFIVKTHGQPKVINSKISGTYENVWRYKNDKLQNKSFAKIVLLNDSILLYILNDNKNKLTFNTTQPFGLNYIGRKITHNGTQKWFLIRDDSNIGFPISFNEFTDTTERLDFFQSIKFDWRKSKFAKNPEPSRNPYEIYKLEFLKNSFDIQSFRTFKPDNGDLGIHHKINDYIGNYFSLDSSDLNNYCKNCFFSAKIKRDCRSKFIPIPEEIKSLFTKYNFNSNENVLVKKETYMNYAFVITLDANNKVKKYGWILRNYLIK